MRIESKKLISKNVVNFSPAVSNQEKVKNIDLDKQTLKKHEIQWRLAENFRTALGENENSISQKNEIILAKTNNHKENRFDEIILEAAKKHDIDPNLIKAVIKKESSFDPKLVSRAGAKGLMQLTPVTIKELKRLFKYEIKDPFDPRQNIEGGTKYLAYLLRKYNGNLELALAAYNAGPGKVNKFKGIPPFKETQNYVKLIKQYYQEYKHIINNRQEK